MVTALEVVLVVGGGILLFDIGGIRSIISSSLPIASGLPNIFNPPAISSTSRILGFTPEGTITGTEIIKQIVSPPQRVLSQPPSGLRSIGEALDIANLKRAIEEFGFNPLNPRDPFSGRGF